MRSCTPRATHMARLAVALAVIVALAAMALPASAQQEGSPCGPVHDNEGFWTWIAVPVRRMAATSGLTAVPGVDGCATSDRGPFAHVSAQLPYGTYNIFAVSFRAAGPTGLLTILAGNANTTSLIRELRSNNDTVSAGVLDHFSRCQRREFTPRDRRQILKCNPEVLVQGHWVALFAASLTVCDMMVCANQQQFTGDGVPLTRAAALSLPEANDTRPTARSAGPAALPETCAGYTTQNWGKCPNGKQCVRTYKPGDDVCNCWHCSAFTGVRSCEQGDTNIGSYSCCFTCPNQPVCAVCQTPCNPVFERIEVIPGVLPTQPSQVQALSYSYTTSTQAINMGLNPQTITVTFSIAQALTATLTYAEAFQYSEKASVKVGIPFLDNGLNLEFGSSQTFTTTTTNTATQTTTYTTALQQQIPPLTMQIVNASAKADTITTRVPVTIKTFYTCNKVETKENFALIKTEGTLSATAAQLNIVYGAQYPIDQPIVLPQANATCASNPVCSDLGLRQGNCCPDNNGAYLSCCSFCVAHLPACQEYALTNTTMCCPAQTNKWNPCCGNRPTQALP